MARKFVFRALRKQFLPVEVRQVLAVIKALPRLWRGLCCLLHGRLDVEVLDAVSIGPDLRHIHTCQERLGVASVARLYDLVCRTLELLK